MKAFFRRAIAILMAGVMGGAVLTGCGSSTTVDGSKTVMTVNDEKVRLGVLSFYARYYQAMMTNYYGAMVQQQGTGMFDQSTSDSSDKTISTYGQSLRKSIVDDVEQMVVISQHAKDKEYKVSLTDDQKKQIKAAAKAYISNNSQEVRDKIGATEADVEKLLELQTIKSSMMDPMVKDVSTKVTQKESQQSKVTYVSVAVDTSSSTSSSTTSSSSTATASSAASSGTSSSSSTSTKTSKKAARAKAKETAQKVLDAMKAQSDVASADMDTVAKSVDSSLSAVSGNYTTNDTTDGTVDSSIVKAVKGLSDGTLVDKVVESKNKNNYYVVRFDKTNDEESTASKKESIISTRKQTAYEKLTKQWVKKADIKVNNRVLKTLTITDRAPYTLKTESTASSTTPAASSAASTTSSTAAASSASAAASSTASAASTTSSTTSGTSSATSSTASASGTSSAANAD